MRIGKRKPVPPLYSERIPDFPGKELLWPKEMEVLYYLIRGFTSKGIANILNMASYRTVESHTEHIHKKLGLTEVRAKSKFALLRLVYSLDEIDALIEMGVENVIPHPLAVTSPSIAVLRVDNERAVAESVTGTL